MTESAVVQDSLARMVARAAPVTIPIVAFQFDQPHQHGTGTLFRVADRRFLISAAHVGWQAVEAKVPLFVANDSGGFVPLPGGSLLSKNPFEAFEKDPFDLGIWELPAEVYSQLTSKTFASQADISLGSDYSRGRYFVYGFPSEWSGAAPGGDPLLFEQGPFALLTTAVDGTGLPEFLSGRNVALDGTVSGNVWRGVPKKLEGISGCSIWKLWEDKHSPDGFDAERSQIVGIQIGVYDKSKVIRGTLWEGVRQILVHRYAELERSIDGLLLRRHRP